MGQEELRDYVKARLKVFYEEELDVPLVLFNEVLDHVLRIDRWASCGHSAGARGPRGRGWGWEGRPRARPLADLASLPSKCPSPFPVRPFVPNPSAKRASPSPSQLCTPALVSAPPARASSRVPPGVPGAGPGPTALRVPRTLRVQVTAHWKHRRGDPRTGVSRGGCSSNALRRALSGAVSGYSASPKATCC